MTLNSEEMQIVRGGGNFSGQKSMLTDNHMLEFNNILRSHANLQIQPTIHLQRPENIRPIPVNQDHLQILFSGNMNEGHWICIWYHNDIVHIYDSMNTKGLHDDHIIYINRLFSNRNDLRIQYEIVQQQTNLYDCGIFAIAFATSIIYNICPCSLKFDVAIMRDHLYNMYETHTITMFPLMDYALINNMNVNLTTIPTLRNVCHLKSFDVVNLNLKTINVANIERKRREQRIAEQNYLLELYRMKFSKVNKEYVDKSKNIDSISQIARNGTCSLKDYKNYSIPAIQNNCNRKRKLFSENSVKKLPTAMDDIINTVMKPEKIIIKQSNFTKNIESNSNSNTSIKPKKIRKKQSDSTKNSTRNGNCKYNKIKVISSDQNDKSAKLIKANDMLSAPMETDEASENPSDSSRNADLKPSFNPNEIASNISGFGNIEISTEIPENKNEEEWKIVKNAKKRSAYANRSDEKKLIDAQKRRESYLRSKERKMKMLHGDVQLDNINSNAENIKESNKENLINERNKKKRNYYANRSEEKKLSDKQRIKEYYTNNKDCILEKKEYRLKNKTKNDKNNVNSGRSKQQPKKEPQIKLTESPRLAAIANDDFDENLINEVNVGNLIKICEFCNAKHFSSEMTKRKHFSSCCRKGNISLPEDPPYPKKLEELATGNSQISKSFRRSVRSLNNLCALASFGATYDKLFGKGPSVIRICGQIYHNAYSLHPQNEEIPKYGQLYIIDNEEASLNRHEQNPKCPSDLLESLDAILREKNPYVASYKMMHEVEREEEERSLEKGTQPREVKMIIKRHAELDKRYEKATSNEVAVVFVGDDGEPPIQRDFCIHSRSDKPIRLPSISKHVDPMTYPLIYPAGGFGWMPNMKSNHNTNNITALQFYAYKLNIRDGFSPYLNLGKLTQQYVVDAWVKVEGSRLYYLKKYQHTLRTDLYKGVMDYLQNKKLEYGDSNSKIGKMVILPSSFNGSPRALQQNFIDAMLLVQKYGKPDLFLTMTCNPKWKEIIDNINENEEAIDRPDIVIRVFHQKVEEFKEELIKKGVFGKCIAFTYVIEFQKRGLPHVHMLIFLDKTEKIHNSDEVDKIISAEIPDKCKYPRLFNIVKQFMVHGPCGEQNVDSPCMDENKEKCTKNFPKKFTESTQFSNAGYPIYRRRNNDRKIDFPGKRWADNRFVVPYNPYLLLKFNCHINVEVCSTIMCIKYLFKYCYKGHDCAFIEMKPANNDTDPQTNEIDNNIELEYDEIKQYINTRYVCPPEAAHRLFEYKMNELSHTIYRLGVHNEDEQNIYFEEGSEEKVFGKNVDTTLTAWFKLNKDDCDANHLLYSDIPSHYVFDERQKKWNKRKKTIKPILSRMFLVSPRQREKFYIRLLLLHVTGAKSFEDLRTVENIVYPTFREAAIARKLIVTDDEFEKCLEEASEFKFPKAMCDLFSYICVFHNPCNSRELYDKFKKHFYDPRLNEVVGENIALKTINDVLQSNGYSLYDFNLPDYDNTMSYEELESAELSHDIHVFDINHKIDSLSNAQRIIFHAVVNSIHLTTNKKYFFIDGPGGSGKSYLLNTLIEYFLSEKINVLPVSWTGIAANSLINGRTVHTTFKLPFNITNETTCNIAPNSIDGQKLRSIDVIVWDEITMASKYAFEAVDRLFRDLCNNNLPFGGKVVVVSGDFRQTLPIINHGNRTQIIENCVKRSQLWSNFDLMTLKNNIRVTDNDQEFKQWLLQIGDGKFNNDFEMDHEAAEIPNEFLSNNNIIPEIFGDSIDPNDDEIQKRVILSPKNNDVLQLNNQILSRLNGECKEYVSIDSAEDTNNESLDSVLPIEFLNSLTPNGLPPHKLLLKNGAIVLLLRNINLRNGLCNGTRLKIKEMKDFLLCATIISGTQSGKDVLLPRITLSPSIEEIPFHMSRRQFPIRLGYSMTINKSQGQTFERVGIYLPSPVFSHGQLYVALSRVTSKNNLKILFEKNAIVAVKPGAKQLVKKPVKGVLTKNIVFKEIL